MRSRLDRGLSDEEAESNKWMRRALSLIFLVFGNPDSWNSHCLSCVFISGYPLFGVRYGARVKGYRQQKREDKMLRRSNSLSRMMRATKHIPDYDGFGKASALGEYEQFGV